MAELKKIKPTSPSLILPEEFGPIDKMAVMAEIELMDIFSKWADTKNASSQLDYYRGLAEVYALSYQDHLQDYGTLLAVDGAIVELFSEIYKHEAKHGESDRTIQSKTRIMVIKNGLELMKKYFHNYGEVKMMLHNSVMHRGNLMRENAELKKQIENMVKAENF